MAPPPKPPVGSLEPNKVADTSHEVVTAREAELPQRYAAAISSAGSDGGAPFAGLIPLLNSDLSTFSSPASRPAHEPAGIAAAHADLFGAFDDRQMLISRIWRTPSEQTIEWTLTGTDARDWKGVPASHKPVAIRGATLLWTKDDGSITDIHVYFDVAAVKVQLGATTPKELVGLPPPTPPTAPPQVFEQSPGVSPQEKANVDLAKSALDALENNNEAAYVGTMADNVEVHTLEQAQPPPSKDEARTYFRAMHKGIGQLDTQLFGGWGVGSFAIVEYSVNGEQLGPIGWIPMQRDRVVRFEVVDVCEVKDGKIARIWRFDDPLEIAEPQ